MERALRHVLTADPSPPSMDDVEAWWQHHRSLADDFSETADRALVGGFAADRLGFAFASGYTEALRRLLPGRFPDTAALCATERGGNRPRHIETALRADADGWRMTGRKTFTTLGRRARHLVVFAVDGVDDQGRNKLAAVVIPADRDGVVMTDGPATPFAPEIPHASTILTDVRVEPDERLPGDAYDLYLKPFRTVEDCHVWTAAIGWWIQLARRGQWPAERIDRLAALAVAARALAIADPTEPAVHLAFGGLADQTRQLLDDSQSDFERLDPETRQRWTRDRALLSVAGKARAARLEVARRSLSE